MRLALASELVTLQGIPGNTGSTANAQAVLELVTPVIEAYLGTRLPLVTYIDFFSYTPPKFRKAFEPFTLRLSAGFVNVDSIEVRESIDGKPLRAAGEGQLVSADDYTVDAERGTITVLEDLTQGQGTVMVSYEAGFEETSEGDADFEVVPSWLVGAAKAIAMRIMQANPLNVVDKKIVGYKDIQNALYSVGSVILNPHIRPRMGLIYPDRTTQENG